MPRRIFVTGMGIITGIGKNLAETKDSLFHQRSGIGKIRFLDTDLRDEIPVSEVKFSLEELFHLVGISYQEGYSRNVLMGIIAAKDAYKDAGINDLPGLRTGLISATTVGGMDQCEMYYQDFLDNDSRNIYIDSYDCADSTEKIADVLGISDYLTTISTACSSSANSIQFGARLIRNGDLDRVIAGGTESLTKFHLNGFNALKILDKEPSKPFDERRNGINLGEGAAYLVLESEEAVRQSGKPVICELTGWGNACEAFHQTASSPEGTGAYLAMKKALEISGLGTGDIGYINAHGTGTDNNDISEGRAIEKLFGTSVPPVSSTKPYTGHTTSAAGATEAIISILCLLEHVIWPNLNFSEPMKELNFTPVKELMKNVDLRHVMTNSFGFGGNDTSLIFSTVLESEVGGRRSEN
ncbi:MAG: beta-ketoacyl-[acyl-carrier-protein] synthase family protein [Bacteroidetes bacterium]|nr:beta-ketoacyl-[acyl-carrier-protein] synthase family protein [Bacteroidota bacterium]